MRLCQIPNLYEKLFLCRASEKTSSINSSVKSIEFFIFHYNSFSHAYTKSECLWPYFKFSTEKNH